MKALKNEDRLVELQETLNKTDIDILGIAEIRRGNNKIIETQERLIRCHAGNKEEQGGVVF